MKTPFSNYLYDCGELGTFNDSYPELKFSMIFMILYNALYVF